MPDSTIYIVQVSSTKTVVNDTSSQGLVQTTMDVKPVLVSGESKQILTVGVQGPQGATEDDMTYSKRVDFVGDSVIYRGEAAVGSSEGSPVWRIRRLTVDPDGDITEVWANGSAAFTSVWSNRLTYNYE